jgi:hypothetical protein
VQNGSPLREQREEPIGTVAFTCMGIALMVILLITLFGHLF